MPGETNSSMGFLDLQFGAMDIISDGTTFDGSENKYNTSSGGGVGGGVVTAGNNAIDANVVVTSLNVVDLSTSQQQQQQNLDYTGSGQKTNAQQSSISSALTQSVSKQLLFFFIL